MSLVVSSSASAAEDETRLIDKKPFDRIVLNAANKSQVLDVSPLDLPNREVPSPFPGGKLQVRLLNRPAQLYDVQWSDIAEIQLYEDMLIAEANELTAKGKFNEAFEYYFQLLQRYPEKGGLHAAVDSFLQQDALAAYKAGDYDRALAVLLSLYERNPNFAGLSQAIDGVGGKIIEGQLKERKFAAARNTLELMAAQFPQLELRSIPTWRQKFSAAASQKVTEAQKQASAREFANARRTIRQALDIWPTAQNATSLLAKIDAEFPMVSVGVMQPAPENLTPRIDSWPSLRCSRLVGRSLTELVDYGSEGGIYSSPLGSLAQDAAGTTVTLQVERQRLNTDATPAIAASVSRLLLGAASDDAFRFGDDLTSRVSAVRLEFPDTVQLEFAARHVRPEALLQVSLPVEVEQYLTASIFREAQRNEEALRFEQSNQGNTTNAAAIRSVEEVTYGSDSEAVTALVRGEIDMLDRIPPWQIANLQSRQELKVSAYRLPTVHVIIPNPNIPLPNKREFRRALAYGIDRENIVKQVILGGQALPGFQVISGPFPAGISQSDPVRYAYNTQIQPRPYDPRLAALLSTLAWKSLNAPPKPKTTEPPVEDAPAEEPPPTPPMPAIRLAHPADPLARTVCNSIKTQLNAIGIPLELVELRGDSDSDEYELRYVELAVWEPLVDANRVLGIDGIAGTTTDYMIGALRQLDTATSWNQVQARLYAIHELAHNDLPVIPLWQTVNYFAYRSDIQGVDESPVVLYQSIGDWHRTIRTAQAR